MGVFLFVPAAMGSSSRKSDKKSKEHKKKKVVEPESESSEEVEVPEEEVEDNVQEDSSNEDSSEEESPSVGQKRKLEQKENGDAKKKPDKSPPCLLETSLGLPRRTKSESSSEILTSPISA